MTPIELCPTCHTLGATHARLREELLTSKTQAAMLRQMLATRERQMKDLLHEFDELRGEEPQELSEAEFNAAYGRHGLLGEF